ncbi:MAG: hypothetical protein GIKADHBN_01940 [Phycisphaerales bacterium]|nr:hypothetical protein [Phycisphaerales bacterium]
MTEPSAAVESSPSRPVGPATDRVLAIDACRGFALLGIFMVNIGFFSSPLGEMLAPKPPDGETVPNLIAYYITHIFFMGKFYAQFSLLFGIGLILQMTRVESAGRRFAPLYLRRLFFLLALGFAHAIFMWYGDILFTYAVAGVALLIFRKARPRTLLILSLALVLFTFVVTAAFSALALLAPQPGAAAAQVAGSDATPTADAGSPSATPPETDSPASEQPATGEQPAPAPGEPAAGEGPAPDASTPGPSPPPANPTPAEIAKDPSRSPVERLIAGFKSGLVTDPSSPIWMQAERDAYAKGDFGQAIGIRAITWASMITFELIGFGWHVLAMFFLGAALHKWGLFDPARIDWHRRFVRWGVFAGIPIAIVGTLVPKFTTNVFVIGTIGGVCQYTAGPLMGLMYIGLITLAVHHGVARWLTDAVSSVGRMALTNYLLQTVIATSIFYWYGLGYFDQVSGPACMGIVVGVYVVQVIFSNLWLSFFRFGPMEWLWRTFTYLHVPPLLR